MRSPRTEAENGIDRAQMKTSVKVMELSVLAPKPLNQAATRLPALDHSPPLPLCIILFTYKFPFLYFFYFLPCLAFVAKGLFFPSWASLSIPGIY